MLRIRLARAWRKKRPFFKVVLTEHSKPVQTWFKSILWWYNPLNHESDINIEEIKKQIEKWAKPTERVARILYWKTKDEFFRDYYTETQRVRTKKKED